MPSKARLWLGTSGFSYKEWKDLFYPKGLPANQWLDFYSRSFNSVEINSSFYGVPLAATLERYREKAPKGFIYSVKAWKLITHYRRLANCRRELADFLKRAVVLKGSLGPILFQLPRSFKADLARLENFLKLLPKDFRYVVEFRHDSWLEPAVYDLLDRYGTAVCRVSSPEMDGPKRVFTGSFGYWRLHGRKKWYFGNYSAGELADYADEIRLAMGKKKDAYIYFDNTALGDALEDAKALQSRMGLELGRVKK